MSAVIYPFTAMADLPNRIREWRQRRKLTQLQLALELDCSVPQVSDLERGGVPLTLDWMERVARALDVAVSDLLRPEHVGGDILSPDERDLMDRYRAGDDHQRQQFRTMADVLVPYRAEPPEDDFLGARAA